MHEHARPAAAGDVDEIARLSALAREELSSERGGPMWGLRESVADPAGTARASIAGDGGLALVGCLDDVVVGYALACTEPLRDGRRLAVLTDIYVEPEARDVGVGEALMDAVLDWARSAGCTGVDSLALPGMRASKNFFERYGLVARAIVVHRRLGDDAGSGVAR